MVVTSNGSDQFAVRNLIGVDFEDDDHATFNTLAQHWWLVLLGLASAVKMIETTRVRALSL